MDHYYDPDILNLTWIGFISDFHVISDYINWDIIITVI